MTAALLLMALQIAGAPPPEDAAQDPQSEIMVSTPIRITPLPAARAFDAFRSICMETFPDMAGFDRAAAASGLGFTRAESPQRGSQEWTSRHGQIVFRQAPDRPRRRARGEAPAPPRPWIARCDFWVAIAEQLTTPELISAIGTHLLGGRIQPREEIVGFSWDLGITEAGIPLRLLYLPASEDNRVFTLSLQRLPDARPR